MTNDNKNLLVVGDSKPASTLVESLKKMEDVAPAMSGKSSIKISDEKENGTIPPDFVPSVNPVTEMLNKVNRQSRGVSYYRKTKTTGAFGGKRKTNGLHISKGK